MKGQATFSTQGDCERSSGNIYADLEFDDANAMHTKAQLVSGMSEILKARGVTRSNARHLVGISPSQLSRILRGHFRQISERELHDFHERLRHG